MTATLERIDEALWLAEGETISFYGFAYPTRSVIVRLAKDRLWVWSPIRLSDELRGDIERLGQVAHLVSPNKLHHLYLAQWKSAYPAAKLWGPQSTVARCRKLEFARALGEAPPPEWGGDIDQAWFRGSFAMDEVVFFHRPSQTAIVADLIQAFDPAFLARNWPWWARPLARCGRDLGSQARRAPRMAAVVFRPRAGAIRACKSVELEKRKGCNRAWRLGAVRRTGLPQAGVCLGQPEGRLIGPAADGCGANVVGRAIRGLEVGTGHGASTAFQISEAVLFLTRSLPSLN